MRITLKRSIYILVLYSIVHSFLLFNRSFFWDDWIWVSDPSQFFTAVNEMGVVFFKSFFYEIFRNQNVVFIFRFLVFVCFLISSLLFYKSLILLKIAEGLNVFFAALLFCIFPYHIIGRSTLCTAPYALSFALFCIGYYAYVKYRLTKSLIYILISVVTITLSFNTSSFLVLYVIAFSLTEWTFVGPKKEIIRRSLSVMAITLIHAGLFFMMKNYYFPSYGYYVGYNKIHLLSLKELIALPARRTPVSLFDPLMFSLFGKRLTGLLSDRLWLSSLFFYIPLIVAYRRKDMKSFWIMTAGILLIMAAIFPYIAVGKYPQTYSWDSRFQLLIPFGAAIWWLAIFQQISSQEIRKRLCIFLIFIFSFGTVRLYLSVQGLRYQEMALMEGLAHTLEEERSSYILRVEAKTPGIMDQSWSFYELSGMAYKILKKQDHPIILESAVNTFSVPINMFTKNYLLRGAAWSAPFYCITMTGFHRIDEWKALKFLYQEFTLPKDKLLENIMTLYRFKKTRAILSENNEPTCPKP